jgi:hypothetical protein
MDRTNTGETGGTRPLATGPNPAHGGDLAGVAVDPSTHGIAYTTNNGDHSVTLLTIRQPGQPSVVANLAGATNLAINPQGNIYVAQLSSGTIAEVVSGKPKVVTNLLGVVAVEFANGHLYASTAPAVVGGNGPGKAVVLSHRRLGDRPALPRLLAGGSSSKVAKRQSSC